jgi:hypothetical protein
MGEQDFLGYKVDADEDEEEPADEEEDEEPADEEEPERTQTPFEFDGFPVTAPPPGGAVEGPGDLLDPLTATAIHDDYPATNPIILAGMRVPWRLAYAH